MTPETGVKTRNSEVLPDVAHESARIPQTAKEAVFLTLGNLATNDKATETAVDRSREVFRVTRDPNTFKVTVESDVTLEDYRRITDPEDFKLMLDFAQALQGKRVSIINPTMEGGGVAMMRPPFVHLLNLLGVEADWFVMEGREADTDPDPFVPTKKIHNIIQRRLPDHERLTKQDKNTHWQWATGRNAEVLRAQPEIQEADVIVIDDPQPTPLLSHIESVNWRAKFIWRNHIDNDGALMNDPSTAQGETWQYLKNECGVSRFDAYVFHPSPGNKFIPKEAHDRAYLMPATTEPHDDMNRELLPEEIAEGIAFINEQITMRNQTLDPEDQISAIDLSRPAIAMVARFDESKGGDKWMAMGIKVKEKVREKLAAMGKPVDSINPQIIFIGNGSVDDPSGPTELERMLELRREYGEEKSDIILARLAHNYAAINAFMHKREEGAAIVGVQMSDAEGCETRISDWIEHGVPMVVSNRGGMQFQIIEGSGIILDFDKPDLDLEQGADFISGLIVNSEHYEAFSETTTQASHQHNQREYTTTANVTRWLRVFNGVLSEAVPDKVWKISELVSVAA